MMLADSIKQTIKKNAQSLGIDPENIYSYSIDPNVRANEIDRLVILITEIDNTPFQYGSNYSINRKATIQIQLFFPNSFDGDTSVLRDKIRDILETSQWYCTLDTAIKQDPDVAMLMNTTHWEKSY